MSGMADPFLTNFKNRMNADEEFLSRVISGADEPWPHPEPAALEAVPEVVDALLPEAGIEPVPEAAEIEPVPEAPEIEPVPEVVDAPPAAPVNPAGKRKKRGASSGSGTKKKKKQQAKPKYNGWWDDVSVMSPRYPASEFNRGLHMGRPTFHLLCAELHDAMVRNDPPARQAIPVPTRVAVALMRLAHGMPYREICVHFDMGVSTAHKLFQQFCRAVRAALRDRFVVSPSAPGQDLYADTVKAKFEALTGIPGVTGAVYTTHVHIIAPQLYVLKYFNPRLAERNANKKGSASYSVVFQCTVDADGAFTDIFLGSDHPDGSSGGSKSDEYVLLKSNLNDNQMMIPGAPPVRLLGGASYPLTDYLLVPYARPSSELTGAQEELNQGVVAGSAVANEAFMKLKARWAFLRRRTEMRIPDLRVIFETCCVLHNFCERFWDELDPELAFELEDDVVPPEIPVRSAAAAQERDAIAHSLFLRRRANN